MYRPIADEWDVIEDTDQDSPSLIATARLGGTIDVVDAETWQILSRRANDAT